MIVRPALAAAVLLAAAGCGSSANKAGGSLERAQQPLVMTLVTGDSTSAAPELAAAVERLSRGSIRIDVVVQRTAQVNLERFTVEDVRAGKAQLGLVGARVFDTMGATSLRALVAPFLVDSMALEQQVVQSPLADRMLAGLDPVGVVGLGLLPGRLRYPLGISRPLLGPESYRGATIGIRIGGVARTTFDALGATAKGYVIGHLSTLGGAELDPATIVRNGYDDGAKGLTGNVVLWPNVLAVVANPAAFGRLTSAQKALVRRAVREAFGPARARIEQEEGEAAAGICDRHPGVLTTASPSELAALRSAVRPVYDELEQDPLTRELIAQILILRGKARAETLSCPGTNTAAAASRLQGLWRVTASADDLLHAGANPLEAGQQRGETTFSLARGRWVARELGSGFVWSGRYIVRGRVLILTTTACSPSEVCGRDATDQLRWSVYRDRLSLTRVVGSASFYGLIAKPLSRVR